MISENDFRDIFLGAVEAIWGSEETPMVSFLRESHSQCVGDIYRSLVSVDEVVDGDLSWKDFEKALPSIMGEEFSKDLGDDPEQKVLLKKVLLSRMPFVFLLYKALFTSEGVPRNSWLPESDPGYGSIILKCHYDVLKFVIEILLETVPSNERHILNDLTESFIKIEEGLTAIAGCKPSTQGRILAEASLLLLVRRFRMMLTLGELGRLESRPLYSAGGAMAGYEVWIKKGEEDEASDS